ncbi:acyltransferase [Dyadobacter psychrotolerans]|nr:acyltransferase [Dyadobacter psychrotolerans]
MTGILNTIITNTLFWVNLVDFENLVTSGIPIVMIARGGKMRVGRDLKMNNDVRSNPIGRPQKCTFFVDKGATLLIGNHVGISQAAIVCHQSITIGDNVKIGGGVCIYDTDFHSLDPMVRQNPSIDMQLKAKASIFIEDNVFIGAHSTILKGVHIGKNAVIGACSVVTKNIPDNQIWAGNPAKFIKNVHST